ncbi:hypothetical protein ABK040_014346 [Willaertia magna]
MSALTLDGSKILDEQVLLRDDNDSNYKCLSKHLNEYTMEQFNDCYKIKESIQYIIKYGFRNIALQFPDELLSDASLITFQLHLEFQRALNKSINQQVEVKEVNNQQEVKKELIDIEDLDTQSNLVFLSELSKNKSIVNNDNLHIVILGDTSYSSCCVDEIGSQHANCDFIIHYGNACLQKVNRIPVFHVFGINYKLDINNCCNEILNNLNEKEEIIILYDLINLDRIEKELKIKLQNNLNIHFAKVDEERIIQNLPKEEDNKNTSLDDNNTVDRISGFTFPKPKEGITKFFFIGEMNNFITQIMMEYNTYNFTIYSSFKNTIESSNSNNITRTLNKRFLLIQRAKETQVFGILVATLSVENYMKMVDYVKRLILDNDRKFYLFFVGKINVPKLANFMEIDMFVLIGCSQNSLIDSRDFVKPVITPFELELALKYGKEWTGYYQLDFNKLLLDTNEENENDENNGEEERYDFSLRTGTVYKLGKSKTSLKEVLNNSEESNALVLQEQQQRQLMSTQYTPSMLYLMNKRTFKGLGQDEKEEQEEESFATIEEGRSGIAREYTTISGNSNNKEENN